MGTRADFYIGRGKNAQWLGSIGWDGYPTGEPKQVLDCKTEEEFKQAVLSIEDLLLPENGWPWPWSDSNLTDYAYAFDEGEVYYTAVTGWHKHSDGPEPETASDYYGGLEFPDMTNIMKVNFGPESGLIIITPKE